MHKPRGNKFMRLSPKLILQSCTLPHIVSTKSIKIYLPQGAMQFRNNRFFYRRVVFLAEYMIFNGKTAKHVEKSMFPNLVSLVLLRLQRSEPKTCGGDATRHTNGPRTRKGESLTQTKKIPHKRLLLTRKLASRIVGTGVLDCPIA